MLFPVVLPLLFLLLQHSQAQCVPNPVPIPDTITAPFALEVHNSSYPQVHNRRLSFWKAGGGDNHLYLSPAGDSVSNHTLVSGVVTNAEWWFGGVTIRAVINGEVAPPVRSFPHLSPEADDEPVHVLRQHHQDLHDSAR